MSFTCVATQSRFRNQPLLFPHPPEGNNSQISDAHVRSRVKRVTRRFVNKYFQNKTRLVSDACVAGEVIEQKLTEFSAKCRNYVGQHVLSYAHFCGQKECWG